VLNTVAVTSLLCAISKPARIGKMLSKGSF
jgi:hypothetical protein